MHQHAWPAREPTLSPPTEPYHSPTSERRHVAARCATENDTALDKEAIRLDYEARACSCCKEPCFFVQHKAPGKPNQTEMYAEKRRDRWASFLTRGRGTAKRPRRALSRCSPMQTSGNGFHLVNHSTQSWYSQIRLAAVEHIQAELAGQVIHECLLRLVLRLLHSPAGILRDTPCEVAGSASMSLQTLGEIRENGSQKPRRACGPNLAHLALCL